MEDPRAKKKPFLRSFTVVVLFLFACLIGARACAEGHPGFLAILLPLILLVLFLICRPGFVGGFQRGIGRAVLIFLMVFVIAASVVSLIGILAKVLR